VGDGWILTIDGWGEDGSSSLWRAEGQAMTRVAFSNSFDSLGYFYGAVTKALGFIPHRHEGKVLGLAAYCRKPESFSVLRSMIDYDQGRYRFLGRMERGLYVPRMENPLLAPLVSRLPREDIAAGTQQSLEQVVAALVDDLGAGPHRLMVAGGVFANVKLNQRLAERPNVSDVYVFPNMGDGGLAAGAAWLSHVRRTGRMPERFSTALLGHAPGEDEVLGVLRESGLAYSRPADIDDRVGELLASGHVVARCAGPMEYGPRALGNRSILYHAADPAVNEWLNRRLKRSEFMPFAPATLADAAHERYIGLDAARETAKFMAITFACTRVMQEEAPAAVHVDGTARPQVIDAESYPVFHRILSSYRRRTGRASIINTSFNMHEEPIVCSASDAMRAFRASDLPYLVLGDYLVTGPSAG
jgi:carbamoyltransferase